jgi:hypothetical protein
MLRIIRACAVVAACAVVSPVGARGDEPSVPVVATPVTTSESVTSSRLQSALGSAWLPTGEASSSASYAARQRQRVRNSAGPNIGAVGLGAVGGLSDFEIGPSFRYWMTDRFGLQAHLGFGGDEDFLDEDVEYMRFEPTFIVAIGDFGNDALNVRPYAGGGIRVSRTDIGQFDETSVRPAGVGGVEFGFRGVPRLKASAELSLSAGEDIDEFDFEDGPSIGGARVAALIHYFFD